jgi:glucose-6-phosphate isomerase
MDIIGYDYTNVTADAVGAEHGLTEEELSEALGKYADIPGTLEELRAAGGADYMNLPGDRKLADEIAAYADEKRGHFENFVVAGIGGSSLGCRALFEALCHPVHNLLPAGKRGGPRMFFPDNVDPELLAGLMDALDPAKTLVNVITKSGSTAETMANFLILADWLRRGSGEGYASGIAATTDPQKGALRKIAGEEGFEVFPVPPGVGGRFTVLSAVGLVSSAFAGIDIHRLLGGAAEMERRIRESDPETNPALVAAIVHTELDRIKGKDSAVFMPYAQCLRATADWFRQLWAESLGKKLSTSGEVVNTGQTPIAALGTTDQHSQIQLYVEGPNDKLLTFVEAGKFREEVRMPDMYSGESAIGYLRNRTLNELMAAELAGTRIALTEAQRPNATILVPAISEETMGQLLFMLEVQTSYAGMILNVNPYDQPGVEAGKVAAFALMGREGYEDRLAEIEAGETVKRRIV